MDAQKRIVGFVIESQRELSESGGGFRLMVREESGEYVILKSYPNETEAVTLDQLVRQIFLDADMEGEGRGAGTHVFQLQAQRSGEKASFRRMTFRTYSEGDDVGHPVKESATSQGLVEQLMRHLEAVQRGQHATLSSVISGFEIMFRRQDERLAAHEKTQLEVMLAVRSIAERNEEREQALVLRQEHEARVTKLLDKAIAAAPFILPGIAQALKLIPSGEDAKFPMIKAIHEAGEGDARGEN